jgi:hypothetical protein
MKKTVRKLNLSRETLYWLDAAHLKEATGGLTLISCPPADSVNYCPTFSCRFGASCGSACCND